MDQYESAGCCRHGFTFISGLLCPPPLQRPEIFSLPLNILKGGTGKKSAMIKILTTRYQQHFSLTKDLGKHTRCQAASFKINPHFSCRHLGKLCQTNQEFIRFPHLVRGIGKLSKCWSRRRNSNSSMNLLGVAPFRPPPNSAELALSFLLPLSPAKLGYCGQGVGLLVPKSACPSTTPLALFGGAEMCLFGRTRECEGAFINWGRGAEEIEC